MKKKMRNLNSNKFSKKKPKFNKLYFAILLLINFFVFKISYFVYNLIIDDLNLNYIEQYQLHMNGKENFCSPNNFKVKEIFKVINSEILNQNEALDSIEKIFVNSNKFNSVALIGSSGVGKTKFSQLLKYNFPWSDNIQHKIWMSYETDENNEKHILETLQNFQNCGKNLIIIDDLMAKHLDIINNFNKRADKLIHNSNKLYALVIYIFNLSRYGLNDEKSFQNNLQIFGKQKLNSINLIHFRTFNETDIYNCIEKYSGMLKIHLNENKTMEIMKMIKAKRSGCKNVHAKVSLYRLNK